MKFKLNKGSTAALDLSLCPGAQQVDGAWFVEVDTLKDLLHLTNTMGAMVVTPDAEIIFDPSYIDDWG